MNHASLSIIHGAFNDQRLHIAHNADTEESYHGDYLKDDFFPGWESVSLKITTHKGSRYFKLEPSQDDNVLHLYGGFLVTGKFNIVEKINNTHKASLTYHQDVLMYSNLKNS